MRILKIAADFMDYALRHEQRETQHGGGGGEMMYQFLIQIQHWPVKSFNLPTLGFKYLKHLSINFGNACVHLAASQFYEFLNISDIFNFEMWNGFEGRYGQKKSEIRKYANLSQPWNLIFFENEIFFIFFNPMPQKYLNKILTIFNDKNNKKPLGKVQNIRDLEGGWTVLSAIRPI